MHFAERGIIIKSLRSKLAGIYLLNVADLIFTRFLISTGFFVEANILMKPIISGLAGVFLKVGLAAFLLFWLSCRLNTATVAQMRIAAYIINGCLGLYLMINISHLIWFAMLIR